MKALYLFFKPKNQFHFWLRFSELKGIHNIISYPMLYLWSKFHHYEISPRIKIGNGFRIYHNCGVIINENTIIGNNVTIHQFTTIGTAMHDGHQHLTIIGDNVFLGASTNIIGDIKIGKNAVVGAGSVVTKDIPDHTTVVGNPAHIIKNNSYKPINAWSL